MKNWKVRMMIAALAASVAAAPMTAFASTVDESVQKQAEGQTEKDTDEENKKENKKENKEENKEDKQEDKQEEKKDEKSGTAGSETEEKKHSESGKTESDKTEQSGQKDGKETASVTGKEQQEQSDGSGDEKQEKSADEKETSGTGQESKEGSVNSTPGAESGEKNRKAVDSDADRTPADTGDQSGKKSAVSEASSRSKETSVRTEKESAKKSRSVEDNVKSAVQNKQGASFLSEKKTADRTVRTSQAVSLMQQPAEQPFLLKNLASVMSLSMSTLSLDDGRTTETYENTTTLADGSYDAESFGYTGGTGKAVFTCEKVVASGGKSFAVIRVNSTKYTKYYANGKEYATTTDDSGAYAQIPVILNKEFEISGLTTAMTEPHWVNYKLTITLAEPEKDDSTAEVDNTTGIADGTYRPDNADDVLASGGSGKTTISCPSVRISSGKAVAQIRFSSGKYTQLKASGRVYSPKSQTTEETVFEIPVTLNENNTIIGTTVAMSSPHDISYEILIRLTADSEKLKEETDGKSESSGEKNTGGNGSESDKSSENGGTTVPTKKQKLGIGTWKVQSDTDRRMFYMIPKGDAPKYSILKVTEKGMTATITLSGEGYDYLCMGSVKNAVAAGKKAWSKYRVVNGYYTYTIPVSALDKNLKISAHSRKLDQWFEHTIIFYSGNAKKTADGTAAITSKKKDAKKTEKTYATSGKQKKFKNDKKAAKVSKWKDDSSKSTSAVNSSTTLKDGVYTPDGFSWSGGSGRLAYIRCNKITVRGGQAYATIEFGSSQYDSLKAAGRVFSKSGGGNSTFTIPVKLNANNTIIGRTTAMSQPHWVKYTIFISKAEGNSAAGTDAKEAAEQKQEEKQQLSSKAPQIMGLTALETQPQITHAKYFQMFQYEGGITLLQIDRKEGTAADGVEETDVDEASAQADADTQTSETDSKEAETDTVADQSGTVEYDEDGKPVAKSQMEITDELYRNPVVNYLLAPEDAELPAGLDKDYILVKVPAKKANVSSKAVISMLEELDALGQLGTISGDVRSFGSRKLSKAVKQERVKQAGTADAIDYRTIIEEKTDLAILPAELLPAADEQGAKMGTADSEADKNAASGTDAASKTSQTNASEIAAIKEKRETFERRFTALGIPVLIDRSVQEADDAARAEWIRVYGALFGLESEAERIFREKLR